MIELLGFPRERTFVDVEDHKPLGSKPDPSVGGKKKNERFATNRNDPKSASFYRSMTFFDHVLYELKLRRGSVV